MSGAGYVIVTSLTGNELVRLLPEKLSVTTNADYFCTVNTLTAATGLPISGGTMQGAIQFAGSRVWNNNLNTGPWISQFTTWTGTNTIPGAELAANFIVMTDHANAGTAQGQGSTAFLINQTVGTAAKIGNSIALDVTFALDSPTGNTSSVFSGGANYVAGTFTANISANDNGTSGTPMGGAFAGNFAVNMPSAATYWMDACGIEIDMLVVNQVVSKVGLLISEASPPGSAHALYSDTGIVIAGGYAQGNGPGWGYGLTFGGPDKPFSFSTTATLIGAYAQSGTLNAAFGVDLSRVTFSVGAFYSNGFFVDGSGNVTAASLKASLIQAATGRDIVIQMGGTSDHFYMLDSSTTITMMFAGGTSNNLTLGSGAALATTASTNMVLIPTCAGAPTGTVGALGGAAFIFDSTDSKLYVGVGGTWKSVTLT